MFDVGQAPPGERIAIIGSGGAGKSTLSRRLGELTGLTVVHLDTLFWCPGWVGTPQLEWEAHQREVLRIERWIMDGNFGSTLDLRLAAADAVIFLDMPRYLCLWRVAKRLLRYHGRSRPDLPAGCPETFDWSFLKWVWSFPAKERPEVLQKLAGLPADKTVIWLCRPSQVREFLDTLGAGVR